MKVNEKFFLENLKKIDKILRYTGNEPLSQKKDNYKVKITFFFPDHYEIGMSNLGNQILYTIVNAHKDFYATRAYIPYSDFQNLLNQNNIELYCLEDKEPVVNSDLIAFNLQSELVLTTFLYCIKLLKLNLFNWQRLDKKPIIIVGGPIVYSSVEVLKHFADVIAIGDGEEIIIEIMNILKDNKGLSKIKILEEIAKLEGVIVPLVNKLFTKRRLNKIDKINHKFPIPLIEVTHDRLTVEVMRGCVRSCRFCFAGFIYRPLRIKPVDLIIEEIKEGIKLTGYENIGLLSLSISDYPYLEELLIKLESSLPNGTIYSLPSLRVDTLKRILKLNIDKLKKGSITLAPETASNRMLNVINKGIDMEQLLNDAFFLLENGWRHIKLYFMIGLPTETFEDLKEIANVVNEITKKFGKKSITVNISPFVPKPITTFQFAKFDGVKSIFEKVKFLKSLMKGVKIKYHNPYASKIESILSIQNEETYKLILEAFNLGAKMELWNLDYKVWEEAIIKTDYDLSIINKEKDINFNFSWQKYIDCGISNNFFKIDWQRAKNNEKLGSCIDGKCRGCGPICSWYSNIQK